MVVSRHQRRFIDEIPWSLQTSFYPMSLVQQGASRLLPAGDIPGGTVVHLKETLGIEQGRLPRHPYGESAGQRRSGVFQASR